MGTWARVVAVEELRGKCWLPAQGFHPISPQGPADSSGKLRLPGCPWHQGSPQVGSGGVRGVQSQAGTGTTVDPKAEFTAPKGWWG